MSRYDKAFKEEAVRLSDEIGPKKAAAQLGVSYYTLQDWRKQRTLHGDGAYIGSGRAYASAEKTARELELEREINEFLSCLRFQYALTDNARRYGAAHRPFRNLQ